MRASDLSEERLAKMIDHTALKPDTQSKQIVQLCQEACEWKFGAVCVAPAWIDVAKKELTGMDIKIASVIGFPHGNTRSEVKAFEAEQAINLGANELDMVINIGALKDSNERAVMEDIEAVVKVAHSNSSLVKVIIEARYFVSRVMRKCVLLTKTQILAEIHRDTNCRLFLCCLFRSFLLGSLRENFAQSILPLLPAIETHIIVRVQVWFLGIFRFASIQANRPGRICSIGGRGCTLQIRSSCTKRLPPPALKLSPGRFS